MSRDLASTLDLESLLDLILDRLGEVVEYGSAAILGLEGEELRLLNYRGPVPQDRVPRCHFLMAQTEIAETMKHRKEPLVVDDVRGQGAMARAFRAAAADELETTFGHIRSWMGVPLLVKERAIGLLSLSHDSPNHYTPRHASLALAIASQAAIAIENARLYEGVRRLAALEERQRLARELHDSVSQALYGIGLGARTARMLLDRAGTLADLQAALLEPLDYVLSLADAGLTEMRALLFELRPDSLEKEGLVAALTRQAAALRARHRLEVHTTFGEEPPLPFEVKEALYRIAIEALNNAAKHAGASRVEIRLAAGSGAVTLEIEDHGAGFDPQAEYPGHMGLQSMRERAARVGGELDIQSAAGQGTLVRLRVPAAAAG
jgi:signal transduction histidine kinase